MKHVNKLVRRITQHFLGDQFVQGINPRWKVIKARFVDIYYPKYNLGIRINESTRIESSNRRIAFDGEHYLILKKPQDLLKQQNREWLRKITGVTFLPEQLPYSLFKKIKYYRPEHMIKSRKELKYKRLRDVKKIQLEETRQEEVKRELRK